MRGGNISPAPVRPAVDRPAIPILLASAVVLLDQATKALVVGGLGPNASTNQVTLLGPALVLRYVENTGAAFGMLRGRGGFLSLAVLVILAGLVVFYRRVAASSPSMSAAVGLIAGGAVGNLIDRARLGYVVDFVAIGPWPTFNLADSAISIGVVLLSYGMLVGDSTRLIGPTGSAVKPVGARARFPSDG